MSFQVLLFPFLIWALRPTFVFSTNLLNVFLLITLPWPNQLQLSPIVRPTRFLSTVEARVKCLSGTPMLQNRENWGCQESERRPGTLHVELCVGLVGGEQVDKTFTCQGAGTGIKHIINDNGNLSDFSWQNKSLLSFWELQSTFFFFSPGCVCLALTFALRELVLLMFIRSEKYVGFLLLTDLDASKLQY